MDEDICGQLSLNQRNLGLRGHSALVHRLKKSFYYGKTKENNLQDHSSLPLTEVTFRLFELTLKNSPKKNLDVFDMQFAASVQSSSCVSPSSILLALIYIQRIKEKNPEYLRSTTPCELFVVSLMIASKFLFDDGEEEEVFNDEWAVSSGLELKEINKLEREFLSAIEWRIFVNPHEFYKQMSKIEAMVALREIKKRGSFEMTYQEVLVLSEYLEILKLNRLWLEFIESLTSVILASSLTYSLIVAGLLCGTLAMSRFQYTSRSWSPQADIQNYSNPFALPFNNVPVNDNSLILSCLLDADLKIDGLSKRVCELYNERKSMKYVQDYQLPVFNDYKHDLNENSNIKSFNVKINYNQ